MAELVCTLDLLLRTKRVPAGTGSLPHQCGHHVPLVTPSSWLAALGGKARSKSPDDAGLVSPLCSGAPLGCSDPFWVCFASSDLQVLLLTFSLRLQKGHAPRSRGGVRLELPRPLALGAVTAKGVSSVLCPFSRNWADARASSQLSQPAALGGFQMSNR